LNKEEIGSALKHFEAALKALGYRRGGNDLLPRILGTMGGLFKRSGLLEPEAQMIKGLSRRICEKVLSSSAHEDRIPQKES
jgi:tRNA C32,U32 (ribose-2'-O)-methylase TrmJ